MNRRFWYWKVFVHSDDGIRFASRVLACSTESIVLLLDRTLPVGKRCDIRVMTPGTSRNPEACREVVFQAVVVLAVFQSMNVCVTFRVRSLGENATSLLSEQAEE